MELLNLTEYEAAARAVLPQMAFDYIAGGADDEITVAANRAAFGRLRLRPRMLAGSGAPDLRVSVCGVALPMPVMVAPMAFHQLVTPDGEIATARAAGAAGALLCVSTAANYSLEDVAAASAGPRWFQLYCYKDRGLTESLVERARDSGYSAIVLTADAPMVGRRERDIRNRFTLPPGMGWKNAERAGLRDLPQDVAGSGLAAYVAGLAATNLTWADLDWLAQLAGLPVLVKGILRADDTHRAAEHGAAGVIVSNHGGRQLDTTIAAIDALPEVAAAARENRIAVLMDGGIRRGTDALKALALGAEAILVGRPVLWGLAVGGAAGAQAVLEMLRGELALAMTLAGCRTVAEITPDLVAAP